MENRPVIGADPYVLKDPVSGRYFAYCTGEDDGEDMSFNIYESEDLVDWRFIGKALDKNKRRWAKDWFWAPECYYSPFSGKYFLFYSGRIYDDKTAANFGRPDFIESAKIGVAVSDTPAGPFVNITAAPLDYFPYNPTQPDLNRLKGEAELMKPCGWEESLKAPKGVFSSLIDVNVFFDDDKRQYMYFSRCAYPNWIWDPKLSKFVEQSDISGVELDPGWFYSATGDVMPRVKEKYIDANHDDSQYPGLRKDGFVRILGYDLEPQDWESYHTDDYRKTGGKKKDRRWSEGSTTFTLNLNGKKVYCLTYSANFFESPAYGVGLAFSDSPLGRFKKYAANPIIMQKPEQGIYSTGHGSLVEKDGKLFYVFHGRQEMAEKRSLYVTELKIENEEKVSTGAYLTCEREEI